MTRRLIAAGAVAAAIAAMAAPSASAAPANIIAGNGVDNVFNPTTYAHDGGTVATMTWAGGTGSHDVTSTTPGLFQSATIFGGTTPVSGTQFLSSGSYAFFCTVHGLGMSGTLNVTGNPLAKPAVELKVKSKSLDQVLRKGEVKVGVTITGGSGQEEATVDLRLGKKRIATAEKTTGTRTLKLELTSGGENRLSDRASATVKAEATIQFGDAASAKGTLK